MNDQLQKLANLTQQSQDVLIEVKTIFPLQIFPGVLTVEKSKLEFTQHHLFNKVTESMLIQDIASIKIETYIFAATLEIASKLPNPELSVLYIPNLPISSARTAMDIIQGLLVSQQAHVNIFDVPTKELAHSAQEIGTNKEQIATG